ncbi:MAG TPA: DUF488 domain-containing protein [Thermodesulfobacteriota bacterium]|nr:DUF488 domain-containing protein [Thermodesulfobacteriota bacterium]
MIKIKRAYEPPAPGDGTRILVDRLWPRGITKEKAKISEWLKELSPSTELRKWYAHDPAKWPEFKKRYRKELAGREDEIRRLRDAARKGTVTLVFSSKELEINNAAALKEIIGESD